MLFRSCFILLAFGPLFAFSQATSKTSDYLDATLAFGKYQGSLAIHYTHFWNLGKSQRLSLGFGGRITSYIGANQYYVTAPAQLTSESTSPLIFFKDNIEKNIDTLLIKSPQVTMMNVSLNIQYRISKKITAGFNIDALGFSFGGKQSANYINGNTGANTQASPTSFNILLISDNDRGSLNSELFARYAINDRWSVRGALQFLFTEYTTETKVQQFPEANDRFRVKSFMLGAGVTYKLK
ncbi:hypothetical protein BH10BAC4_BH10BAC4_15890 [soil metagenome]